MNDKIKGWKIVKKTQDGQEYIQSTTLKEGPRSKTTAVFFRNRHKTTDDYIISLKISHNSHIKNKEVSRRQNCFLLENE